MGRNSGDDEARLRIEKRVSGLPYWYHKIELPHGIVTPGWAPINPSAYGVPDCLEGKRVLDVGAWDGYWTFLALQRGAREVVAIDDFSDFLGRLRGSERQGWDTFDLCRELLGYEEARCKRIEMSVYDATEQAFGRFDTIFFFGTLYHLRYPLLALDQLASICDGEIFVESAILDDYSPYQGGLGHGYKGDQMVMEFYPGRQYGENATNWWVPTLHCLIHMIAAAGFSQECRAWKLLNKPETLDRCRGFVHGRKVSPSITTCDG
jgi:tRNA (mo5U34)-methyltransferase